MGFKVLNNTSEKIVIENQSIDIIGVENWGKGFKQKGDLRKATSQVNPDDFKILLSHDPSHWEHEVIDDQLHYHLRHRQHQH